MHSFDDSKKNEENKKNKNHTRKRKLKNLTDLKDRAKNILAITGGNGTEVKFPSNPSTSIFFEANLSVEKLKKLKIEKHERNKEEEKSLEMKS